MRRFKHIALTGEMGTGKDTVARILEEKAGYFPMAFADSLKSIYHMIFDVPYEPKPRAGYQWFGQICRSHDENVWIKLLEKRFKRVQEVSRAPVVITDLRQLNEYQWARQNGFLIVRVTAPLGLRIERMKRRGDSFSLNDLEHETEKYINEMEPDFTINNDGSMNKLEKQADALIEFAQEGVMHGSA